MKLQLTEQLPATLRELYGRYGYAPYKMSKFEEYDLYVRNKDFLISDSVITFTDRNGRLMALKPDVTLSIVKNGRDADGLQKVYYNENVYRVAGGTETFKEIVQAGIEYIGEVDAYAEAEVLSLAAKSLQLVSDACVLDVSHMGILSALLQGVADPRPIFRRIGEKNRHELPAACEAAGVSDEIAALLSELVGISGTPAAVLPALEALLGNTPAAAAVAELKTVLTALADTPVAPVLRVDLSVVSNARYYSGLTFKGFIDGVPERVLSGGRYDPLLRKMGRKSGAVGFALYLDTLERLAAPRTETDVDAVLLYSETDSPAAVARVVEQLSQKGSVMAVKTRPETVTYGQVYELKNGEVTLLA